MEDVGYSFNLILIFIKDKFGVFVGVVIGDYVDNLREDIDVYYSFGMFCVFLSGCIFYVLGFKGLLIVFDMVCFLFMVVLYYVC